MEPKIERRDSKGRFKKGHGENSTRPKGYNKNSWFKKGHEGIIGNQFTKGNMPNKTSFKKGVSSWNKGKLLKHSGSFKSGKQHPNWQGGIAHLPYPYEFNKELKLMIRKRDNFTCQICFNKELIRTFVIHHIDYDKKNNNEKNLITLCRSCHAKTNSNREAWIRFFKGVNNGKL